MVFYDRFVSAHPRNDPMLGGTFLTVERLVSDEGNSSNTLHWKVVYTDADWETM